MKSRISVEPAAAGVVLLPKVLSAHADGKPSYQSLLAKSYAPNQPHLYEFPATPRANSLPLIVPRLSNIPDSRVILLGQ